LKLLIKRVREANEHLERIEKMLSEIRELLTQMRVY